MQKSNLKRFWSELRPIRKLAARAATISGSVSDKSSGAVQAPKTVAPCLEDRLHIAVCETGPEEVARRTMRDMGQFLARQDRWEELTDLLLDADTERSKTPGGMPISDLLAFGARADIVHAAEHALIDGQPDNDAPLLDGISALEEINQDLKTDPIMTTLVAQTHVDIAWAWRGTSFDATVPRRNREAFGAHMDRADELICGLPAEFVDNSPLASATRAGILIARPEAFQTLSDVYERLIDLDPTNYRHMRILGNYLLPRWFGSYDRLELEARRTASRTQQDWGAGAYARVQFDAIAADPRACQLVDVNFFIDGLRDIAMRRPDQPMINMLTAYCAIAMVKGYGESDEADFVRTQIADCARWLIKDHLTEVHPLIWAHAAEGFDNSARVTSLSRFAARGRADALRTIAEQFADDIARGLRVTFTKDGPQLAPV